MHLHFSHDFRTISIFPSQQIRLQPKLKINAPGDQYEQEADAMAEWVMRMSALPEEEGKIQTKPLSIASIQRKCAACEEEEKVQRQEIEEEEPLQTKRLPSFGGTEGGLMRKATGGGYTASPQLSSQLNSSKGSGSPLPGRTLASMNRAFGADFSGIRIHTDSQAAVMSQGIQAKAFTHGSDVYFNRGQYSPESAEGKRLLGHELTHVVQQGALRYLPDRPSRFTHLAPQSIHRYSLRDSDKMTYPFLSLFINSMSGRITPKTSEAFKKWSSRSSPPSINGDPTIIPADFPCDKYPTGRLRGIIAGMTWGKSKIGLATIIIRAYEGAVSARKANRGAWEEYLEAVIMHELVHWGRLMEDKKDYDDEMYSEGFEKEAYGRIVDAPEALCTEDIVTHTVMAGEDLFQIAEIYYKDAVESTRWYPIYLENNLTGSPSLLKTGQVLRIPDSVTYRDGVVKVRANF